MRNLQIYLVLWVFGVSFVHALKYVHSQGKYFLNFYFSQAFDRFVQCILYHTPHEYFAWYNTFTRFPVRFNQAFKFHFVSRLKWIVRQNFCNLCFWMFNSLFVLWLFHLSVLSFINFFSWTELVKSLQAGTKAVFYSSEIAIHLHMYSK